MKRNRPWPKARKDDFFCAFDFAVMQTPQRATLGKQTQSGKLASAHNTTLWTNGSTLCNVQGQVPLQEGVHGGE